MTPGCTAVCSWRRLLASRHLPLPSSPPYTSFLSLDRLCQLSCFTALCRVHTEEGNYSRCWPGASKWTPHTSGGPLPNGGFWAAGCSLAGSLPQQGHIPIVCVGGGGGLQ